MSIEQLRHKNVWHGEYKGFMFEIVNWSFGTYGDKQDKWNHYVLIQEWKQKELFEQLNKFVQDGGEFDYYAAPCADWEWHYGITYGEKTSPRVIKVGCDYQHAWDEGRQYDLDFVYSEALKTIDSIAGVKNA